MRNCASAILTCASFWHRATPARADTIAAEIRAAGLTLAQRSKGESPDTGAVYLADTLGEMPLWYSVAAISVIGGSFSDLGGHTPFEPAQCGTAILHGPHVWNHAAAYRALDAADARMARHRFGHSR